MFLIETDRIDGEKLPGIIVGGVGRFGPAGGGQEQVEEYIKQDPESGHVFAFFSRNKKLLKLLQWEDGGFVIWMKRLEQGGFHIPQSADGRIELTSRELVAILSGIKPQRYYKRYSKKS